MPQTKRQNLFALVLCLLCTACFFSCSDSDKSLPQVDPDKTDVTQEFLSEVKGRSFGPRGRYRFTESGRFVAKLYPKAIFNADDRLSNGAKIGRSGTVTCNFLVNAKLDKVTLSSQRLPSWGFGPYEISLSDEKIGLDAGNPVSHSDLNRSDSITICNKQFQDDRLLSEVKISTRYMASFNRRQIQWAQEIREFHRAVTSIDLAEGETLDWTDSALRELNGAWMGEMDSVGTERAVVSKRSQSLDVSLFYSVAAIAVRCMVDVTARIASIRLNSEQELVIQLNQPELRVRSHQAQTDLVCQTLVQTLKTPTEVRFEFMANDSIVLSVSGMIAGQTLRSARPLHRETAAAN